MSDIIKHNKRVFYNPKYHGLHVVHEVKKHTVIISDCNHFYNDAYTGRVRYEIPKTMLKDWIQLNKHKLKSYSFLTIEKSINALGVTEINNKGFLNDQIKRNSFRNEDGVKALPLAPSSYGYEPLCLQPRMLQSPLRHF